MAEAARLHQSHPEQDRLLEHNGPQRMRLCGMAVLARSLFLTSCFSHELTGHLLLNAFSFYFMAPPVLGALGNVGFLGLYLGGGIVSSFVSLWWNNDMKHTHYSSHGASGALYSVITFFACAAPRTTFYLFAVVPMPAWLCVSGLFLYDAYSSVYERGGSTDTAGHVGGVLAGAAYFLAKALRIF
ncbi:hypothetical protein EIP86_011260 [Pleurotus ostreatoroseus]|nr:hypothetical protein EIP86_011260 [Pleurotus ostreatoroseus]